LQPVLTLVLFDRFLVISSYRAMLYLAAATTVLLALVIAGRHGLPVRRVAVCLALMALAMPVGARLLHAAINWPTYIADPALLVSLDFRGYSLYGGLLLSAAIGAIGCRWLVIGLARLADSAAPALGVGIAIARLGCFLAGCCFGKATDLPWGVMFPVGSNAHIHQILSNPARLSAGPQAVHPTQLYELAAALAGAVIALWLMRRNTAVGTPFLAFTTWFSAARWANFYLRVPPSTLTVPEWFYPALYAAIIVISLGLLLVRERAKRAPSIPRA
jgi:phosphatidylglycerol:prolipoprotein diacylglycerol transferase